MAEVDIGRARFGPLRPFGPFLDLESYKAENQMADSKLILEK
jgi:hypothetical protein